MSLAFNGSFKERFFQGDMQALARIVSLAEDRDPLVECFLQKAFPRGGRAHVIGVTGPPGAGKSTLIDRLGWQLVQQGLKLGVLCIDPTSPFSGGAFLGDRIRMRHIGSRPDVFIRSLATRGRRGGLAPGVRDAIELLDAFGMDAIIVETVGAGQVETDVAQVADTTVVVMVPGLGDDMQALKAGLMEIASLFVINMADRPGAEASSLHLQHLVEQFPPERWRPRVLLTTAIAGDGVNALAGAIAEHEAFLKERGLWQQRRETRLYQHSLDIVQEIFMDYLGREIESRADLKAQLEGLKQRRSDPYTVGKRLLAMMLSEGAGSKNDSLLRPAQNN